MKECQAIRDRLSEYLDQELPPVDHLPFSEHLAQCAGCKGELEALGKVRSLVASLPALEVPTWLSARVVRQLADETARPGQVLASPGAVSLYRRKVLWQFSAVAAGIGVIVVAGFILWPAHLGKEGEVARNVNLLPEEKTAGGPPAPRTAEKERGLAEGRFKKDAGEPEVAGRSFGKEGVPAGPAFESDDPQVQQVFQKKAKSADEGIAQYAEKQVQARRQSVEELGQQPESAEIAALTAASQIDLQSWTQTALLGVGQVQLISVRTRDPVETRKRLEQIVASNSPAWGLRQSPVEANYLCNRSAAVNAQNVLQEINDYLVVAKEVQECRNSQWAASPAVSLQFATQKDPRFRAALEQMQKLDEVVLKGPGADSSIALGDSRFRSVDAVRRQRDEAARGLLDKAKTLKEGGKAPVSVVEKEVPAKTGDADKSVPGSKSYAGEYSSAQAEAPVPGEESSQRLVREAQESVGQPLPKAREDIPAGRADDKASHVAQGAYDYEDTADLSRDFLEVQDRDILILVDLIEDKSTIPSEPATEPAETE